jgi:hypothetical protein
LEWHKKRAIELLEILSSDTVPCDYRISTEDRTVTEIAEEVADKIESCI